MSQAVEEMPAAHAEGERGERVRRWADCTRLLLGLTPFFLLPVCLFPHFTDPTREGRFLLLDFVACLLLFLEVLPSARRPPRKWDLIHVPLLGLGVLFLIHLVVDPYLPGAFGREFEGGALLHHRYALRYVVRYGAFLVWVALIISGRFGRRFPGAALDLSMMVSIPVAIYAVMQHFDIEFIRWEMAEERMRVVSTIGNPLYLADYLAVALILSVGNAYRRPGKRSLLFSSGCIFLLGFALHTSASRGGVISLAIGLFAFIAVARFKTIRRMRWKRIAIFAVAAVLLVSILAVTVSQLPAMRQWTTRFQDALSLSDFSVLSRLILWQACLRQWSFSPWIGVGMEQFRLRYLPVLRELIQDTPGAAAVISTSKIVAANEAHSEYVQVLTEWGVVGFAFFTLLLVLGIARSAVMAVSTNGPWTPREQRLGVLLFGLQAAFGAEMLYAFPLRLPAHALLVFSCWAFSTYLWRFPVRRVQRSPRRPWGWATAFRRLPISLAALLVSAYAIMVCRAESAGGAARSLLLLNKTTQAESVARIAHRLLPEHGDFTFLYAITLWERSKDIATVLELLHRAQLTSTNTRIPIAKGLLLMKNRRNQEAYRVLEDIASFQAPLDGLHHARGLVEYLNENYEEAALQLEAEVRQYPRNYEAHLYLAACYRILQKTALAIETLQRALSIKPGGLDAHIQLSEIYEQTRDYEEAERELQQAVDVAADLGDFETATELTVRLRQLRLEGGLN